MPLATFLDRGVNRPVGLPTAIDSLGEGSPTNTLFFCPSPYGLGNTANGQEMASPGVSWLLASRDPLAVTWAIVSIVINPFEGIPFRWLPHIFYKIRKGIKPSGTNLDSPTPVILVRTIAGIATPSFHVLPNHIPACRLSRRGVAMFCRPLDDAINLETAATFGIPRFEAVSQNHLCIAAITATVPKRLPSCFSSIRQNQIAAVSVARNIFNLFRDWVRIAVSHVASPFCDVIFRDKWHSQCHLSPLFYPIHSSKATEIHEGRPDLQRNPIPCFQPGSRYYIP